MRPHQWKQFAIILSKGTPVHSMTPESQAKVDVPWRHSSPCAPEDDELVFTVTLLVIAREGEYPKLHQQNGKQMNELYLPHRDKN